MGTRLQKIVGALLVMCLFSLGGCAEDIGLDQHGQKVPAERLEGQWLVINYWAEWCGPCRSEIPELNALAKQLDGQSVQVLGVNYDGEQGEVLAKSSEQLGIAFTVLADDPAARFQLPAATALPVTYIVDEQGQVRETLVGEQTAVGLMARLTHWQGVN
ncbi:MAG: TlpA disulfide reductase family protein [Pseudomonas sp.]|uniref:TlpA disulfide reductase family protein n=1 Tax=Pseudomonas sp. TaxID=306 RepID=UPI00339AE4BC